MHTVFKIFLQNLSTEGVAFVNRFIAYLPNLKTADYPSNLDVVQVVITQR